MHTVVWIVVKWHSSSERGYHWIPRAMLTPQDRTDLDAFRLRDPVATAMATKLHAQRAGARHVFGPDASYEPNFFLLCDRVPHDFYSYGGL